jgi:SAM-dependent methyltransferase
MPRTARNPNDVDPVTDQTVQSTSPDAGHLASGDELWDLYNLANARRLCDFQFEQVPDEIGTRVLEVGAGIGTFSARLLEAGAQELLLIEPEEACVGELEKRFAGDRRVKVAAEFLPDAPSLGGREGTFDFALSQNVFEHVEDDHAAVAAVAKVLRPGGRLMILVPAHPRLYGPLDKAYGHYRRYTRERLRSLVEGAGLEVERLYSFNALGILGWWAKSRTGAQGIGSSPLKVYEAMLAAWRPIERRFDLPVGLSLIVHARRPLEAPNA